MGRKGQTRETSALWQSFGKWIKQNRERTGVKQTELAEMVGIHPVQLSRIENGAGTTRGTVIKLAHSLDLDMREAFNRAGLGLMSMHNSLNATQLKLLDYLGELPGDKQLDLVAIAKLLWMSYAPTHESTEKGENVRVFNKL